MFVVHPSYLFHVLLVDFIDLLGVDFFAYVLRFSFDASSYYINYFHVQWNVQPQKPAAEYDSRQFQFVQG